MIVANRRKCSPLPYLEHIVGSQKFQYFNKAEIAQEINRSYHSRYSRKTLNTEKVNQAVPSWQSPLYR